MGGEDDIDLEALQAQLNISLSSLEQMVSSWIKPAAKATLPKSDGLTDRELGEIMRQPPRCASVQTRPWSVILDD
jgi:hypothetical protein